MPFMPFDILGVWFKGLLSLAILAGGLYLLDRWYESSHVREPVGGEVRVAEEGPDRGDRRTEAVPTRRVFRFRPGWNEPTAYLAAAVALLIWASLGLVISRALAGFTAKGRPAPGGGDDEPREDRTGEVHWIDRPDGSKLRVECYGPREAPPVVFSHGWGVNSTAWFYAKKSLARRYRLILWDEPGMGLSKKPDDNDYRMENLAADLDAVLAFAGARPAVLVGHSIGGMITLTFCRLHAGALKTRVAGLALANTTYKNPVRTTKGAAVYTALEKPVIIPLLYLTIATWPLVWAMNWLAYLNGSIHRSTHKSSFAGTETQGQLDFCARLAPHARPDVLARGMLGMIAYDETATLATIDVPTLVVVGDRDTTTPPEAGQFMARGIPGAESVTLSPARHMGLMERHPEFDEALGRFVASCSGPVPA